MTVPGLPQGVQLVRFGIANPDEFEIIGNPQQHEQFIIVQGPRGGSISQMIVTPSPGWKFREYFDVRLYMAIFVPAQDLAEPQEFTLKFRATDTFEVGKIQEAMETAKFIPGYIDDQGNPRTGATADGGKQQQQSEL